METMIKKTTAPACCRKTCKRAIEDAAELADELGTYGYENGLPHTERDGYGLGIRIRRLKFK
jgi:hypothetical protein